MKTRLLIILTLLLGSAYQAEAVDIYSRKLNTTNGLPDNNVRCLAQDCKGFLWMGTSNGLYRFDGYFYTNYRYADEGNLRLLNNNHINGCYALADGRMLFSNQVFIMRWTVDSTLLVANTKGDIYEADKTLRLRQIPLLLFSITQEPE